MSTSSIKSFDRATCRKLSEEVEKALAPLGEKFGLSFEYKGGRYSTNSVTMKIEASTLNADGSANSQEAEDFKQMASFYGLEPEDLNAEIPFQGEQYKITGLAPRSRKYPILVERLYDGKGFKLPLSAVQRGLGRKVTA